MRFRNPIVINGLVWTLEEVETFGDSEDLTVQAGECDPRSRTIRVLRDMHSDTKREAIWHEFLHACCYSAGVVIAIMPHRSDEPFTPETAVAIEEKVVTLLTPVLLEAIKQNRIFSP